MIDRLFMSVGAMKAGTTWLYEQLRRHPEIFFTPEKEIHYFANMSGIENQLNHRNRLLKFKLILEKYGAGNPSYILANLNLIDWYLTYAKVKQVDDDWYEALFRESNGRICADFSNLYCQMESSDWGRVRLIAKNIKVIYTLRNPIDRVWSHYKFHLKWIGKESEALSLGVDEFENIIDKNHFWINARYAKNFTNLKNALNANELMLLYFEDFRKSPVEMLEQVCDFLGVGKVPESDQDLSKKINKTKDYKMPDAWRAIVSEKLRPEICEMKKIGLWRTEWEAPF